ncbi:vacuolar sorting protein 39 domain 1-domain-containing protein [Phellopilus nigrolimitatus]|nr:vacuolar sorting protein 39 domain 1-domain-containing protein [Phellopilus nigrolimitatus]
MAPFCEPLPIINGFKEKVESLTVQGDRIYIGSGSGNLHVYNIDQDEDGYTSELVTTKSLSKKPIEQVGYIKDINSVVALSDSCVTLYPLPDLFPPTPLLQTRKAFSFAVNTTIENVSPDGNVHSFDDVAAAQSTGAPTLVTYLIVGSQRKLVVYSWRDGEAQEVKEASLSHSARVITFLKPTVLCLAYTATEHTLFYLETMSTAELTMPVNVPSSTSAGGYGRSALSGLGGYMTLGLAAKAKPQAVVIGEDVLIPKDNAGIFYGADGKAKQNSLVWNAPPEEIAYVKPYVLSIQSAGTIPASTLDPPVSAPTGPNGFVQAPVLQIQSSITLQPVQHLVLPTASSFSPTLRLLTPSSAAKGPVFAVSTPVDRNAAAVEGSAVWLFRMRTWGEQIDELVEGERYSEALALLESIDGATLPDKASRLSGARFAKIRALNAVAQFKKGDFDGAMNAFIELDINPAKVVALYPEGVSGRLHIPPERCIPLFGGPEPKSTGKPDDPKKRADDRSSSLTRTPSPASSMRSRRRGTLESTLAGVGASSDREDDRISIRGRTKDKGKAVDTFPRSVETLLRYLTDRRPRINGALATLHITNAQSHQFPFLSETSVDELLALPNAPLASLTPEQLTRFAQIVDTALFKAYLIVRPGLLGPLCSLDNWCEVAEVEEVLMEREKFSELVSLYKGRKMHGKALGLLKRRVICPKSLSEKESDIEDRIRPTVSYVQKLGPEYLDQIFEATRWVFEINPDAAFDIFTAELVELPRSKVADFLEEDLDPALCAKYLEYLIGEREETSTLFHDRLAELYLEMAVDGREKRDEDAYDKAYSKFLHFIQTSDIYRVDRLFGLLPSDDMFEAKAVLLGRLGRHESALETYVYRLGDYVKAEEYCKSIYIPDSPTQDIFLSLLKIYLEPSPTAQQKKMQTGLLKPALDLISRQSPRLDTLETLRLLPPLVPAQDVKAFLCDAARAPIFATRVVREMRKGRGEQVGMKLVGLQSRRVRVTDGRICPQCHKRLGNSVIAVHAPRGEVTHYQCREAFANSKRRAEHVH